MGAGAISSQIGNIGKLGVMLFFVLSGFLITYLLLSEEKKTGKIHSHKFYIRRFLRITPLYFLIIIVVYFVLQNFSFWEIPGMVNPIENNFYSTLALHIFFLPNLVTALHGFLPYIAQAWSIGTEEQSYLLWPVLLRKFKKNRLHLMLGIIGFYIAVRIALYMLAKFDMDVIVLRGFWRHFNIDSTAVGGLFAVLIFNKDTFLRYIVNRKVFYSVLLLTASLLFLGIRIPYFHYLGYSILFGIIIVNLATENTLKKRFLEWRPISYLGKISYGIYMYHLIVMTPIFALAVKYNLQTNWLIYPLIIVGSIIISSLSYHFYESIFLKLKTKFTLVRSGGSEF